MTLELETAQTRLTYQPKTIIYKGKEYPAPQVIDNVLQYQVRSLLIEALKVKQS
jgi:hypothetical protein